MAPRLGHGLSACARAATLAAAFALLTAAPFLGKAWHIDEALFLPAARQILADPLHPYGFSFNWYGDLVPYSRLNNTPPVLFYLLALAYKATGGAEWAMRLSFWPFDAAAAVALYLIAARFLQRPLLPVLIVLACPAYLINMGHLMAEKPMFCFVLWSLYGLLRAVDGERPWFWASAGFLAAALLCKYSAESLEQRWPQADTRKFYAAALAFSLSLSFALEAVDMRYADAQRWLAGSVSARFSGRRIWFSGHWGLQHYLEQRGGLALERSGGWDQVRGGDVVVLPRVNTNVLWPDRQVLALRSDVMVGHWLPLRLISAGEGQGGFYSDVSGFLPFSLSRAPVEEFALLEIQ